MNDRSPQVGVSRLRVLALVGAVTAATVIADSLPAGPAQAAPDHRTWTGARTHNQWPIVDQSKIGAFRVEGSDATTALLITNRQPSDAATVLLHVARRFHYEIAALTTADIRGYTTNRAVTAASQSNHLSGTAIALKPGAYPPGATGNLFPYEVAIIRDILTDCDGVVRWNGDDPTYPCEGQFHIDVPPTDPRLTRVAAKIRAWRTQPQLAPER